MSFFNDCFIKMRLCEAGNCRIKTADNAKLKMNYLNYFFSELKQPNVELKQPDGAVNHHPCNGSLNHFILTGNRSILLSFRYNTCPSLLNLTLAFTTGSLL